MGGLDAAADGKPVARALAAPDDAALAAPDATPDVGTDVAADIAAHVVADALDRPDRHAHANAVERAHALADELGAHLCPHSRADVLSDARLYDRRVSI